MDEKESIRNEFAALSIAAGVAPGYADNYFDLVFEISTGLASRSDKLLVVGISGAQGTGKSTFSRMLAIALERGFEKTTLVVSLDDFYLTRAQREQLARDVHPLLQVRGVPGTHDVAMLASVIADLKAGRNTEVPVFDKASDDRRGMVPVMGAELDVLIVEGWCFGALPEQAADLAKPVNALESGQDPNGEWRTYVNRQLAEGGYQAVFESADVCFFLAAPDMETVIKWRWQQERELAQRSSGKAVMDEQQVRDFVMYYQRITLRMLRDMPRRATLTLYLDDRHQVRRPPRNS
ncbi:MAG: hypothetical protein WD994_04745 [Pseudomonadales bacterium]